MVKMDILKEVLEMQWKRRTGVLFIEKNNRESGSDEYGRPYIRVHIELERGSELRWRVHPSGGSFDISQFIETPLGVVVGWDSQLANSFSPDPNSGKASRP